MNTNPFKLNCVSIAVVSVLNERSGIVGGANAYTFGKMGEPIAFNISRSGNTIQSVTSVKTNNSYKAVRVRFAEGKNAREVLDFNLHLSPQEIWREARKDWAQIRTESPALLPLVEGGAGTDWTITYPRGMEFVTPGDSNLERTREGYFEVMERGIASDSVRSVLAPLVTPFEISECIAFTARNESDPPPLVYVPEEPKQYGTSSKRQKWSKRSKKQSLKLRRR
jgi:hypothetical protein